MASGIKAFVAELIMSGMDESEALLKRDVKLLAAVLLVPPESSILQQEGLDFVEEAVEGGAMKVQGELKHVEVLEVACDLVFSSAELRGRWKDLSGSVT